MTKIMVSTVLLAFNVGEVLAQADSIQPLKISEALIEQTSDDSPILDLVGEGVRERSSAPAVYLRSRITQKFQSSAGFLNGTYLGSSIRSYQRITARQGSSVSGGVLMTKDPGEQRLNDFTSWNVSLSNTGMLSRAVVGDYRIEAGEGISLWRGHDFSKGGEVIAPVKRSARGLVPSLSADEVQYFRGLAADIHVRQFSVVAYYSRRNLGASLDASGGVTSFYNSGYYRTGTEQAKRDNLTEKLFGTHCSYTSDERFQIGFTFYRTMFSSLVVLGGGAGF